MFPKESDSIKQHFGITGVQVGEFEEQLVTERTISANPFLVIILKNLGFFMIFLQNEETQEDFGVGDEVLDVVPFDERGKVLEWGINPKSTQSRIPRENQ